MKLALIKVSLHTHWFASPFLRFSNRALHPPSFSLTLFAKIFCRDDHACLFKSLLAASYSSVIFSSIARTNRSYHHHKDQRQQQHELLETQHHEKHRRSSSHNKDSRRKHELINTGLHNNSVAFQNFQKQDQKIENSAIIPQSSLLTYDFKDHSDEKPITSLHFSEFNEPDHSSRSFQQAINHDNIYLDPDSESYHDPTLEYSFESESSTRQDRELSKKIQELILSLNQQSDSESFQDLARGFLVGSYRPHLNHAHLSSFLFVLAQISSKSRIHAQKVANLLHSGTLDRWYEVVSQVKMDPRGLSNILLSFAKLQIIPSENYIDLWYEQATTYHNITRFNPFELSTLIFSFARLNLAPRPSFLRVWYSAMLSKLHLFSPKGLVITFHSLHKLRLPKTHPFLNKWQHCISTVFQDLNAKELSMCLFICAYSKQLLSNELTETIIKAVDKTLHTMEPGDLANVLYSYGIMDREPTQDFFSTWYKTCLQKPRGFHPFNLVRIIYSFYLLKIIPHPDFMHWWFLRALSNVHTFQPEQLAHCIYSLAHLDCCPPTCFMIRWFQEATQRLDHFDGRSLVFSLFSLPAIGANVPESFLTKWFQVATRKIKHFKEVDFKSVLDVCRRMKILPPKPFLDLWLDACIQILPTCKPQELGKILFAITSLRIRPSQKFLNSWSDATLSQLSQLNNDHLLRLIHTVAVLASQELYVANELMSHLYIQGEELLINHSLSFSDLKKLFWSRQVFRWSPEAFEAFQRIKAIPEQAPETRVHDHRLYNMITLLHEIGECRVLRMIWSESIAMHLDCFIIIGQSHFVLRSLGPQHFVRNMDSNNHLLCADFLMQKYLLETDNITCIDVPFYEYDRHVSKEAKINYLRSLIEINNNQHKESTKKISV